MARRFLPFIFSFCALSLFGQETDSVRAQLISTAIRLDYGKLLTLASNFESKVEGGVELLVQGKIPVIIEAGKAILSPSEALGNGFYESEGMFYRAGLGYYRQRTPKEGIGVYLLYGSSQFDEKGSFTLESPSGSQPPLDGELKREGISANWWEIAFYTDRKLTLNTKQPENKLNQLFSLGIEISYRRLIDYDSFSPIDVYSIPGYGRAFDKSIPAVNLLFKITL